jgi:hypothetical protein
MSKAHDEVLNLLYEARDFVEALRLASESMSDGDELKSVIETVTKAAVQKIDAATNSAALDPPITKRQVAKARAYLEREGAFIKPSEAA